MRDLINILLENMINVDLKEIQSELVTEWSYFGFTSQKQANFGRVYQLSKEFQPALIFFTNETLGLLAGLLTASPISGCSAMKNFRSLTRMTATIRTNKTIETSMPIRLQFSILSNGG